jgi:hypothetical protein
VVDEVVVYVGLTKSGLHTRFEQYRLGHKRKRTSVRINDPMGSMLAAAIIVAQASHQGKPF